MIYRPTISKVRFKNRAKQIHQYLQTTVKLHTVSSQTTRMSNTLLTRIWLDKYKIATIYNHKSTTTAVTLYTFSSKKFQYTYIALCLMFSSLNHYT